MSSPVLVVEPNKIEFFLRFERKLQPERQTESSSTFGTSYFDVTESMEGFLEQRYKQRAMDR